jgi:hypothetical protein
LLDGAEDGARVFSGDGEDAEVCEVIAELDVAGRVLDEGALEAGGWAESEHGQAESESDKNNEQESGVSV